MTRFQRYLLTKVVWFTVAFFAALALNFFLPRLIPGNPVDAIVARLAAGGGTSGQALQRIHEAYVKEFALDQPAWEQFLTYLGNLVRGDLGTSFALYPAPVSGLIGDALPWTVALQVPSILIGWTLGNVLGALAAYRGGWTDRGAFISSLFVSSMPYYCLAILLLYGFAVHWEIFPAGRGYSSNRTPDWSWGFFTDALHHYWLPFLSLVLIIVGGQAVGMRSMAIYELGSDYVGYVRSLGVPDSRVVAYIFRNAMLPQVTGLALSIGAIAGGAIITEVVFGYPGIGTVLFSAIRQNDYPVIQGVTLIILLTVLLANFLVDIAYGLIDPRIRAAQAGER
jgi:peptide/nickel transport system permease protein